MGLTHYVYPGALHTRFHHALGAMHLMHEAIEVLRSKDVLITPEEKEGALIAILLHDIGHGPYSHGLERMLIRSHHEEISLAFMENLNKEFGGALNIAIQIFTGTYGKKFLNQLVSGQLDVDRMDYLKRDSFFTGVAEGVIGHDRIIKMLDIVDDRLVVEEKAFYSIEKFLMARRLMYWQVYLHKTVLAAEMMLRKLVERTRMLHSSGMKLNIPPSLKFFFSDEKTLNADLDPDDLLIRFAQIDDIDVIWLVKQLLECDDFVLSFLAKGILNRNLHKCLLQDASFDLGDIESKKVEISKKLGIPIKDAGQLVFAGIEKTEAYSDSELEIKFKKKSGKVEMLSELSNTGMLNEIIHKNFLCFPKIFD